MSGIRLPEESVADRATQFGSSHHFLGARVAGKGVGRRLGLECNLEASVSFMLDYRQDTEKIVEQSRPCNEKALRARAARSQPLPPWPGIRKP